jgi:hypothetical protein
VFVVGGGVVDNHLWYGTPGLIISSIYGLNL